MAVYLRRAISNRNTILVLRSGSSALQSPQNWCRTLCSPNYGTSGTQYNDSTPLSSLDFLRHSRRGFAKAKRSSTSPISFYLFFLALSTELLLLDWRHCMNLSFMSFYVEQMISFLGFGYLAYVCVCVF